MSQAAEPAKPSTPTSEGPARHGEPLAAEPAPAPALQPPPDDVSRGTAVLVALDGSLAAEAILPFVVKIAAPLRLEVALLGVLPPPRAAGEAPAGDSFATEAYLEQVAVGLRERGVTTTVHVRVGDPSAAIAQTADELRADLIAMTTRAPGGRDCTLAGSTAEAVLGRVHMPVLLLRVGSVSDPVSQVG